ncbi:DUF4832 domain-containing protein [Paludibacter sp. 221]|uniref:DUF4832 domain-containing protein n=1 Tax=Paludibacter sp. 221 TaxID=2302939 RepID=UPI0013D269BE|nr:DUF4832 domain-containing protein [Paludibacter sp. 221]NDV46077.1 DUF4832 domain-containing protein [Paludibacter sp. 221]
MKNIFKAFCLILPLTLVLFACNQPVEEGPNCLLTGTVKPTSATITISNNDTVISNVAVDENGVFEIELAKGVYTVSATCVSYVTYSATLNCSGNTATTDIIMTEEDPHLDKTVYTESFESFINPERGFHKHFEYKSSATNVLTTASVQSCRNQGFSLILTIYYMNDFRDKRISDEYLQRIETNMKALREGGSKCVLRFAYTSSESDKPWDAPLDLVLEHIEQLKPYLQEYADVIYVMEAGFVGVWGEWYYTNNFNSTATAADYVARRTLVDALLDALPQERMVALRTPKHKMSCFNITISDTITLATAYNGSDLSRVAGHNDCFLASSNDVGTFENSQQRTFWHTDTKYTIMGGETCGTCKFYSECENALEQMENFHWSYLNNDYHANVLNSWRADGCMEEIKLRLGYRLALTWAGFTKNPKAGENFEAKINLKNVGFAAPANPRMVELVFVNTSNASDKKVVVLDVDPRYWFAGGEYAINVNYTLPSDMAGKTYNIYLNLPDPKSTLKDRSEYSIRLANEKVWDAENGYNKLHTIQLN